MERNKITGSVQRNDSTKELRSHWEIIDSAAERASQSREDTKKSENRRESSNGQVVELMR